MYIQDSKIIYKYNGRQQQQKRCEEVNTEIPIGWSEAIVLPAIDANLPPFFHDGLLRDTTTPAVVPCNRQNCCARVWFLPFKVY